MVVHVWKVIVVLPRTSQPGCVLLSGGAAMQLGKVTCVNDCATPVWIQAKI